MRLTRAARRAEATQEDIPDASLAHGDPDAAARMPLGEVDANTSPEPATAHKEDITVPPQKPKAKGGAKKGAKGRKAKPADNGEPQDQPVVLEDEPQAVENPAEDALIDELASAAAPANNTTHAPLANHQRPASPPAPAVRMTRRQLAMQEEELSKSQRLAAPPPPPESAHDLNESINTAPTPESEAEQAIELEIQEHAVEESSEQQPAESSAIATKEIATQLPDAPFIDRPTPESIIDVVSAASVAPEIQVDVTAPEPKGLASEKPCDSEQGTPARSRTSSRSHSKSPMRLEASFEAIDALEEALENVVPRLDLQLLADDRSPRKAKFDAASHLRGSPRGSRMSKAPAAPKSLKPTAAPRSALARSSSLKAPNKESRSGSGEVKDYLASKRRPISMQFPTPPPPPKSSRAPTKATFQLPGEAIAAKLKAQKEERMKREQEGGQRPVSGTFVAPTVKSTKAPTKSNFQLPGQAVAAKLKAQKEERLRREAEGGERAGSTTFQAPAPPKSSKPPTVASFQLPGEAIAAKLKAQKEERLKREAEGVSERPKSMVFQAPAPPKSSKAPTVPNFQLPGEAISAKLKAQKEERLKREAEDAAKKPTFKARPAPTQRAATANVRQTASSRARESIMAGGPDNASKRSSVMISRPPLTSAPSSSSATSSNRNSVVLPGPVTKSTVSSTDVAVQRQKGREVFNRDKLEKEQRDRERREREDAAKRARAQAAERGRVASREWAEKQRRKMMGVS